MAAPESSAAGIIEVGNPDVTVAVATGFGPRIVGLTPAGGPNLLAELGDLGIDLDDGRRFVFRGGHRLWVAPEVPAITYEPDDMPVAVSQDDAAAMVQGTIGAIEKSIAVEPALSGALVTVDHSVTNAGDVAVAVAPWAITQLRPGGVALLPLDVDAGDDRGLQASHAVVGWRYTDWTVLGSVAGSVLSMDGRRSTPTKVGTSLGRGWLAYTWDGWLFAKYARPSFPAGVDHGAQAQIYANSDFVELETLGALVTLEPGATTAHREVWRIWQAPESLDDIPATVEAGNPWAAP